MIEILIVYLKPNECTHLMTSCLYLRDSLINEIYWKKHVINFAAVNQLYLPSVEPETTLYFTLLKNTFIYSKTHRRLQLVLNQLLNSRCLLEQLKTSTIESGRSDRTYMEHLNHESAVFYCEITMCIEREVHLQSRDKLQQVESRIASLERQQVKYEEIITNTHFRLSKFR